MDPNKYLGTLCKRGHDYNGTGMSLRYKSKNNCVTCTNRKTEKKCELCNEKYLVAMSTAKHQRFCSWQCAANHRSNIDAKKNAKICPICKNKFISKSLNGKIRTVYCSRKCYGKTLKVPKKNLICIHCKKKFQRLPSLVSKNNYCSVKCFSNENLIGKTNYIRKKKGIYIHCKTCNVKFYITQYYIGKKKYCSRKCTHIGRQRLQPKQCKQCKKTFKPDHKTRIFCSKKCTNKGLKSGTYLPCSNCGKKIWRYPKRNKSYIFCSINCRTTFNTKHHIYNYITWIPTNDKLERRRWTYQKRKWNKEIKKASQENVNLIKHVIKLKIQSLNLHKLHKEVSHARSN